MGAGLCGHCVPHTSVLASGAVWRYGHLTEARSGLWVVAAEASAAAAARDITAAGSAGPASPDCVAVHTAAAGRHISLPRPAERVHRTRRDQSCLVSSHPAPPAADIASLLWTHLVSLRSIAGDGLSGRCMCQPSGPDLSQAPLQSPV